MKNKSTRPFKVTTCIFLILTLSAINALAVTPSNNKPQHLGSQENTKPTLEIGENIAVVQTLQGKIKGYISDEIYTFMGIPYGANTGGNNRFLPPKPRLPWTGILPTVFPGYSAPQNIYPRTPNSYSTFVDHWNYDEISEDCLYLNLWTPKLDSAKRPVLVWLHGGGFRRGNGIEQDGYHGANFSKYGDVVFCSINHRLGPLGFSDLSDAGGPQFKDSGNVGMLDIIFALKWVQQNIEQFGGDPDNVTIMGQSGGGAKVCLIAAMPEAKGLFHKAVSLSGSTQDAIHQGYSKKLGQYVIKEAGLQPTEIQKLQNIPWQEYLDIAYKAEQRYADDSGAETRRRGGFGPVADGHHIPDEIFYSSGKFDYPNIPMLFCTTAHEWGPARFHPELENVTFVTVEQKLEATFGDKTAKIINGYRKSFPDKRPIEIWSLIVSSREAVVEAAKAKTQQSSSVYMAWFTWESPLFDGRMRSFHCLDISFWFLNTERMRTHTGGGLRPQKLARKMADSLLNFMRKGTPNGGDLSEWKPFDSKFGYTMLFDDKSELQKDPDHDARQLLSK